MDLRLHISASVFSLTSQKKTLSTVQHLRLNMASSSGQDDAPIFVFAAVKKEVCTMEKALVEKEIPQGRDVPRSEAAESEEDDADYITEGNPFFDVILHSSHVSYPHMYLPLSIVGKLPRADVPVVLRHGGKNWDMSYSGGSKRPGFDYRWKTFVNENHLKIGDACVFEQMDQSNSKLTFKVHILRCDLPPELLDSLGKTPDKAICID